MESTLIMDLNEMNALMSVAITTLQTAGSGGMSAIQREDLCYGAQVLIEKAQEICDEVIKDTKTLRNALQAANTAMDGEEDDEE